MEICTLCGQETDSIDHIAEQFLIDRIRAANPEWVADNGACPQCIEHYESLDRVEVVEPEDEGV